MGPVLVWYTWAHILHHIWWAILHIWCNISANLCLIQLNLQQTCIAFQKKSHHALVYSFEMRCKFVANLIELDINLHLYCIKYEEWLTIYDAEYGPSYHKGSDLLSWFIWVACWIYYTLISLNTNISQVYPVQFSQCIIAAGGESGNVGKMAGIGRYCILPVLPHFHWFCVVHVISQFRRYCFIPVIPFLVYMVLYM